MIILSFIWISVTEWIAKVKSEKALKNYKPYLSCQFLTNVPRKFIRKKIVISTNGARTIGYLYKKYMNLDPYLTPHIKTNLKYVIGLT